MPMWMYRAIHNDKYRKSDQFFKDFVGLAPKFGRVEMRLIKAATQERQIPGARLITGKMRLVVE
jgi:hypothetical protein